MFTESQKAKEISESVKMKIFCEKRDFLNLKNDNFEKNDFC